MIGRRWSLMLCAVLMLAATARAGIGARDLQVRVRDSYWIAPADAASKANPLAGRSAAEAGGRKLFQQRCASCHGEDGRGTSRGPDLTQPAVQSQPDGALFWKITSGNSREGMPAFSFLPAPQRWQLVLRLRSLVSG